MTDLGIGANVERILDELPSHVLLVAAVKGREASEVEVAVSAGVRAVGHNYVQEAAAMRSELGNTVEWHMIGHLQRNKAKTAAALFDVIETVDSLRLAQALDRQGASSGTAIRTLIEVNSGREAAKAGVVLEDLDELVHQTVELPWIRVEGLMTMGPRVGDPEEARPYFRATREAFERLAVASRPGVTMRVLSMGMSNSWRQAVEEGSNLVRVGTEIFGPRAQ